MNELKVIETGPSLKNWPLCLCAGMALTVTGLALWLFFRFSAVASALPALVGLALLTVPALVAGNTQYVVTNRRVYKRTGPFSKRMEEMPIALVRGVSVRREGLSAALGVGDVLVEGASGGIAFEGVEYPEDLRNKILSLK